MSAYTCPDCGRPHLPSGACCELAKAMTSLPHRAPSVSVGTSREEGTSCDCATLRERLAEMRAEQIAVAALFGLAAHAPSSGAVSSSDTPPHESAWLIERGQAEGYDPPEWWVKWGHAAAVWTTNANDACRMPSREWAEARLDAVGCPARVTEHVFLDASRSL